MSRITKAMLAEAEQRGYETGRTTGYREGYKAAELKFANSVDERRTTVQVANALGQALAANSQAMEALARLAGKGF